MFWQVAFLAEGAYSQPGKSVPPRGGHFVPNLLLSPESCSSHDKGTNPPRGQGASWSPVVAGVQPSPARSSAAGNPRPPHRRRRPPRSAVRRSLRTRRDRRAARQTALPARRPPAAGAPGLPGLLRRRPHCAAAEGAEKYAGKLPAIDSRISFAPSSISGFATSPRAWIATVRLVSWISSRGP